jgi:Sporulation protein family 7
MANPPPGDTLPFNADADSYTQHRLSHATPDHLNITSRRCFIGPIPKGWLNSHRKEWYKHHLHINYSSRTATFSAGDSVSHQRSVTALNGQRAAHSFPQPEDLSEEPEESHDEEDEAPPTASPVVPIPSILNIDGHNGQDSQPAHAISNEEDIIDEAIPLGRAESEAEASASKAVGPSQDRGLLSPPAHPPRKASTRMSKRDFGSPEDDAKSKRSIYVDAPEFPTASSLDSQQPPARTSTVSSHNGAMSSSGSVLAGDDASTSPLITRATKTGAEEEVGGATEQGTATALQKLDSSPIDGVRGENGENMPPERRKSGRVNFTFPEESRRAEFKSRVNQLDLKRPLRRVLRRRTEMEGRIVKMERMLVRIDITKQQKLPEDYDENSGEGVITQTLEKWREFMVVCRQASKAEGSDFVLQIYKTRVGSFIILKKHKVYFNATTPMFESYIFSAVFTLD